MKRRQFLKGLLGCAVVPFVGVFEGLGEPVCSIGMRKETPMTATEVLRRREEKRVELDRSTNPYWNNTSSYVCFSEKDLIRLINLMEKS